MNTSTNHKKSESFSLLVAGIAWPPETFLARLIKGLIESGISVTLACDRHPGEDWLAYPHVNWLKVPGWRGSVPGRLFRLMGMLGSGIVRAPGDIRLFKRHIPNEGLKANIQRWYRLLPFVGRRWDMIYFPWNNVAITHLPLFELGMPVIISCRGSQINVVPHDPRRAAIRDGLQTTFKKAAAVHCVSKDIEQASTLFGLNRAKSRVIRPAVDPYFFRPAERPFPSPHNPFHIITVGSLIWRKGYEYALSAIRHLVDNNIPVSYQIIGDGPERQRILYTIHDLELTEQVVLNGRLSPTQVRDHLQQADAFLLPSLSEGIANVALEAMACALPVVSTDCGGMREAITHGREGFIVPTRDADAMAAALITLANAPEHRRSMGQAGRQRILAQFQLKDQVKQFLEMMTQVTSKQ